MSLLLISAKQEPSLLSKLVWPAKGDFLIMIVPGLVLLPSESSHSDAENGLEVFTLCNS